VRTCFTYAIIFLCLFGQRCLKGVKEYNEKKNSERKSITGPVSD
jgi:hypothetical protein